MATLSVLQCKGLQPADNQLAVSLGALVEARNCILRFRDVLEPRRGQKFLGQTDESATAKTFGTTADRAEQLAFFQGAMLVHYSGGKLALEDVGGFADYAGTYAAHDGRRLRLLESNRSLYANPTDGIRVLEGVQGAWAQAGLPRPLSLAHYPPTLSSYERSASGVHPDRANCAYRAAWGRLDAHGRLQVSAVSQRAVVRNAPLKVAIGALSRTGSTVTATYTGSPAPLVGASVTLAIPPSGTVDSNFAVGAKTVVSVGSGTFTYAEAGSAVVSTKLYEVKLGARNNLIEVGMPAEVPADAFLMLYRSLFTAVEAEGEEPDDELYQAVEVPAVVSKVGNVVYASTSHAYATVTSAGHGIQEGQRLTFSPGGGDLSPVQEYTVTRVVDVDNFRIGLGPFASTWTQNGQTFTTSGNRVVVDRQPESLLGAPLYTNPNTGDGIGASNERPPLARDVCEWQGRLWYANTTERHRLTIQLLGVGSPDGVQDGDTLTLTGAFVVNLAASASFATDSATFAIKTTGTPSQNVEHAARELCKAINLNGSAPCYAYFQWAENEALPSILLEERGIGGNAFTVHASRPASWFPALTTSSSGAKSSKAERRRNGLSYSKAGQPEAVPLLNYLSVGPDVEMLRAIPLRDKLFCFPEAGGIYTVSGEYPFRVDQLDGTAWLLAPDSAVAHGNQIFALTNQGVCAISDAGVRVVSKGIEDVLLPLMLGATEAIREVPFAVSNETERQYALFLPGDTTDATCEQAYVYNSLLNSWTGPWTGSRTCGLIYSGDDALYLGDGDTNRVRVERKRGDETDYADETLAFAVDVHATDLVELTAPAIGVEVGDMLWQDGGSVRALVVSVDGPEVRIPVTSTAVFTPGPVLVLKGYKARVLYAPVVPSGPSIRKLWRDCTLHFRRLSARVAKALFDTEVSPAEGAVTLQERGGYGTTTLEGGSNPRNERVGITRAHADATQLRVGFEVQEAHARWALNGFSVEYETGSERNSR